MESSASSNERADYFEHPILRKAAVLSNSGQVRRETPIVFKIDDDSLIEGVLDLALREETGEFAGWTVVDFKTDREFASLSERHIAV